MEQMLSQLENLRQNGTFCDINIKVRNRLFPCHRVILVSAMEYFQSMFRPGNFNENERKEVELSGINADDFEFILSYIYSGQKPQTKIKLKKVYSLLKTSDYLGLQSLEDLCVANILKSNTLPWKLAFSLFMFAMKKNNEKLMDHLTSFIAKDFVNVSKSKKFLRIPVDRLKKVLTDQNLSKNGTIVLNFLKKWAMIQPALDRKSLVSSILHALKLESFSSDWILNVLVNDDGSSVEAKLEQSDSESFDETEIDDNGKEGQFLPVVYDCVSPGAVKSCTNTSGFITILPITQLNPVPVTVPSNTFSFGLGRAAQSSSAATMGNLY